MRDREKIITRMKGQKTRSKTIKLTLGIPTIIKKLRIQKAKKEVFMRIRSFMMNSITSTEKASRLMKTRRLNGKTEGIRLEDLNKTFIVRSLLTLLLFFLWSLSLLLI